MQAVPGPDTMLVIGRGVGQGSRVALWTAVGAVSAGIIQLPLLAAGVASLLRASPLAFDALRYAGAAFLVYLGVRLVVRKAAHRAIPTASSAVSWSRAFAEGMVSNLANPNVLLFMLAFLPQFIEPQRDSVATQLLVLGGVQKFTGLIVLGGTAFAAGKLGEWLSRRPGWLVWQERFAGAIMIFLGLRLVLTGDARGLR
jgi:threonine/homoserine/homoserine lactone efflux protein